VSQKSFLGGESARVLVDSEALDDGVKGGSSGRNKSVWGS
jgi:hypothetical protein